MLIKRNIMPNTYIVKELISDHSYSELDFVLQKKFNFEYDDDDADFITIQKGSSDTNEAFPVEIDDLIKVLQNMKKKGATYAEIEHHVDHIGYNLSGWKIAKATKTQIEEHLNKGKKSKVKEEKIAKLQQEIVKIQNDEDDIDLRSVELFFQEGTSDKVYNINIEPKGNKFVVNFEYGKRGTTLKTGTKTEEAVDIKTANEIFDKLVAEKKKKGYQ